MRWMTFTLAEDDEDRVGILEADTVQVLAKGARLIDLLGDDGTTLREAAQLVRASPAECYPLGAVRARPPIPDPPALRDFTAFEQHVRSVTRQRGMDVPEAWYRMPIFYFSNPSSLFGAEDEIEIPPGCEWFDFELEVGCVMGREARDVCADDGPAYIAGFTIMCDWSARDLQFDEMSAGLGPAKGKDSATSLGPVLVTPDELADVRTNTGHDLGMRVILNGELVGEDRWMNAHYSFGEMIEHASRGTRLRPGDILGSGTCGAGCLAELREERPGLDWLSPGDHVRLEIDRLGCIDTRIVPTRTAATATAAGTGRS